MASNSPLRRSFKRFKRNKPGMIGIVVIFLSVTIAILGYSITPDSTPNADDQVLQVADNSPGFKVTMLKKKKNRKIEQESFFSRMLFGQKNDYELIPIKDYRIDGDTLIYNAYTGKVKGGDEKQASIIDLVYAIPFETVKQLNDNTKSITDVYGTTHQINIENLQQTIKNEQIIDYTYWFGTDNYGRDMLSRIIIGMRISLSVGVVAVIISITIGLILGAIAGFFRGWIDDIIMWFINVVWSIPTLLIAIALTIVFGTSKFWLVFVAVGLSMWVDAARLIRGQIMGIREVQFVEAAKSLGYGNFRIIFKHILPNITGPLIVVAAANFASAILVEAGLSFLGLGVQPPAPSWGTMLSNNYGYIISNKPFLALVPGVAIMILVMAFNLVGNAFRDALDVKTKL